MIAGGAAGDDAGTGGGRLHQHPAGAGDADDRVGDGAAGQRHVEQVLLGLLGALLDGQRHLLGLAVAEADAAVAVADHDERGEREAATALHDLGDAVDGDDPRLAQAARSARAAGCCCVVQPSELQTCFAGGSGDRCDTAVVEEPTAVEHHLGRRRRPWPARRRSVPDAGWRRRRSRRCPRPRMVGLVRSRPRPGCGRPRRRSPAATRCLLERNTARRGRAAVPWIFLRTRRWRRDSASPTLLCDVAHRSLTSCRPCRPCGGPSRRGSARPCPCTARACGCERMLAATWPTTSLSMPLTIDPRRHWAPRT